MDIVSHAAWGVTIIRKTHLLGWAALSGALPDLLTFFYGIVKFRKDYFKRLEEMGRGEHPEDHYFQVHRYTHSLVPISIVALALIFAAPPYWYLTLPYYLHIFFDIFTHQGVWAMRIFYPISDFRIEGRNWWQNKWISLGNWAALILVNLIIFFR